MRRISSEMNSGTERRQIDRLSSQSHKFTPAFDPFSLFQWKGQFSCCSHSETFTPSVSALRSSLFPLLLLLSPGPSTLFKAELVNDAAALCLDTLFGSPPVIRLTFTAPEAVL